MSLLRPAVATAAINPYAPGLTKLERAHRMLRSQRGSLIQAQLREKRDPVLISAVEFWCKYAEGELLVTALVIAVGGEP